MNYKFKCLYKCLLDKLDIDRRNWFDLIYFDDYIANKLKGSYSFSYLNFLSLQELENLYYTARQPILQDIINFQNKLTHHKLKNMLEIQKFLKTNTLEGLKNQLGVSAKPHKIYPNLILFIYSQIDSPKDNTIVKECRGLILDEKNDWAVINYTFSRFFNASESCADKIDWKNSSVLEKVDGSLAQLYYYDNKWHVATKGTPDASGSVGDFKFTFEELFWKTWNELNYSLPKDTSLCYAFELCTKYNRVVVRHPNNRIILHGVRNLKTLIELSPKSIAIQNNWEYIKSHPSGNFNDVMQRAEKLDGLNNEGFVIVDKNFNRIKIKSPKYVKISHLKESFDTFSIRRMLELIKLGEVDELLSYYPEFKDLHDEVNLKYRNFIKEINEFFAKIKNISDQKEFASHATKEKFSSVLFNMRKGEKLENILADMPINKLESLLDIKIHEK